MGSQANASAFWRLRQRYDKQWNVRRLPNIDRFHFLVCLFETRGEQNNCQAPSSVSISSTIWLTRSCCARV